MVWVFIKGARCEAGWIGTRQVVKSATGGDEQAHAAVGSIRLCRLHIVNLLSRIVPER